MFFEIGYRSVAVGANRYYTTPMERNGIMCGGAWCVDHNFTIDHWPDEETLAKIISEKQHGGCPGHNMSTALRRLGAPFPVEAIGLLGNDADGHFLADICDDMGIGRSALEMRDSIKTARTLAMTVKPTGKRTFFYSGGAHAAQTPDDFDFTTTNARIVHLGLPGLHEKLDAPWKDDISGWVAVLKKARAAGMKANIELVSVAPEIIRAAALPMLPWLDTLIINDFEAGALVNIETVKNGVADAGACRAAAERLMETTKLSLVAVHFPKGGVAMNRNGEVIEQSSVDVPQSEVVGSNGAGDCFAAGMLFGHHEGWALQQSLKLAHASSASSLLSATTTESVMPWKDCLALAEKWGWRK
jgi:sugar/nucleoside kinase (ribokinase family)